MKNNRIAVKFWISREYNRCSTFHGTKSTLVILVGLTLAFLWTQAQSCLLSTVVLAGSTNVRYAMQYLAEGSG